MKLIIYSLLLLLILTTASFAKENYSADINKMVSKMKTELNLTEEQEEAIKPIIKENFAKRQKYLESIEEEAITNEKSIKQSINQLKRKENEELSKVLTKEQVDKIIQKQKLKDKLNQDNINYKEYLQEGVALTPQGGSFQF